MAILKGYRIMKKMNLNLGGGASRSLKAFTLAEVLITLAIIGVVAALTIPSVITNYQNTQTSTALKKAYSTLASTTNLAIKDHGPISSWDIIEGDATVEKSKDFVDKYIIPYLRISKNCGLRTSDDCKFEFRYYNDPQVYKLGGSFTRFYLADGTFVGIYARNKNGRVRAQVNIDVNGQKGPNKFGVDIFPFDYLIKRNEAYPGKLIPVCNYDDNGNCAIEDSLSDSVNSNGCNKDETGGYCSHVIMANGWKIPSKEEYVNMGGEADKYPW